MKLFPKTQLPYISLFLNFLYAAGNCFLGFWGHSWWFITVGAYYAVLAVTRFSILQIKRKIKRREESAAFVKPIAGILLIGLSICIAGVTVLSAVKDRGTQFHQIIMIAIATYTFTKITLAIIRLVQARHTPSPIIKALRNITLADAAVSIYTMQRSMLITFPGMTSGEIQLFNILTGSGVFCTILILGINLIRSPK